MTMRIMQIMRLQRIRRLTKRLPWLTAGVIILGLLSCPAGADENVRVFLDGVKAYRSGDYPSAVDAFLSVHQDGVQNGKLFYNLGNAYLRDNRLGPAILWYERALRLIPNDPDLKFNYNFALSRIKDERGVVTAPVFRILFFWNHMFSAEAILWAAIGLNAVFWSILILRQVIGKRGFHGSQSLILVFVLVLTATAVYNEYRRHYHHEAVILPDAVAIRSGPAVDTTELFVLHAGTKVKIEKEMGNHYRIFYSDGKIGWVEKAKVGMI